MDKEYIICIIKFKEFHWTDGSKYVGEFLNDLRDGFGTFYYGDGRVNV